MDSTELEEARKEVGKLLRTSKLTTDEVFGLSLMIPSKADALRVLREMRQDGVVQKIDGKWVAISMTLDHPVRDKAKKIELLERIAAFLAPDMRETLEAIADDIRHA